MATTARVRRVVIVCGSGVGDSSVLTDLLHGAIGDHPPTLTVVEVSGEGALADHAAHTAKRWGCAVVEGVPEDASHAHAVVMVGVRGERAMEQRARRAEVQGARVWWDAA